MQDVRAAFLYIPGHHECTFYFQPDFEFDFVDFNFNLTKSISTRFSTEVPDLC